MAQTAESFYRSAPPGAQVSSPHQQDILEAFLDAALAGSRSGLLVDIGSGRGSNLSTLARRADLVVAVDISEEALREATPAGALARVVASAAELPFTSGSFDVAVCTEVLEHVPDLQAAARDIERIARPGAWLVISTPNYLNVMGVVKAWKDWRSGRKDFDPWDAHRGGYEGFMTSRRLRSAFRAERIVQERGADYAFALGIRWHPLRRRVNRHLLLRPGRGRLARLGMQYYLLLQKVD